MDRIKARNRIKAKAIDKIRQLNLVDVTIEFLKRELQPLFVGWSHVTPTWPLETVLFRGRTDIKTKPSNIGELSYPPASVTKIFQRANSPGKPMFYCSLSRDPVFFELRVKPGDFVAIARWKNNKKMFAPSVGFTSESFGKMGARRVVHDWAQRSPDCPAHKFFSAEFTKSVDPGNEHEYKISVAIAEKIYSFGWPNDAFAIAEDVQSAGIHFPSVAMKGNSDNFALHPSFVDRHLTPFFIEWIRINDVLPGPTYKIERVDFSDTFSENGEIEWAGKPPKTVLGPGEKVMVRVENGMRVFRDSNMKLVGYLVGE